MKTLLLLLLLTGLIVLAAPQGLAIELRVRTDTAASPPPPLVRASGDASPGRCAAMMAM